MIRTSTPTVLIRMPDSLLVHRGAGQTKCVEEERCRMCGREWPVRRWTRHHLVPQAYFNHRRFVRIHDDGSCEPMIVGLLRDVDANIVPLCSPCHVDVENTLEGRRMLRKLLGAAEVAFVIRLRGEDWFERQYQPTRWPIPKLELTV